MADHEIGIHLLITIKMNIIVKINISGQMGLATKAKIKKYI